MFHFHAVVILIFNLSVSHELLGKMAEKKFGSEKKTLIENFNTAIFVCGLGPVCVCSFFHRV